MHTCVAAVTLHLFGVRFHSVCCGSSLLIYSFLNILPRDYIINFSPLPDHIVQIIGPCSCANWLTRCASLSSHPASIVTPLEMCQFGPVTYTLVHLSVMHRCHFARIGNQVEIPATSAHNHAHTAPQCSSSVDQGAVCGSIIYYCHIPLAIHVQSGDSL